MNQHVYNIAIAVGILLTAVGTGLWVGLAAGLVAAGLLILVFTVYGAELLRRSGP